MCIVLAFVKMKFGEHNFMCTSNENCGGKYLILFVINLLSRHMTDLYVATPFHAILENIAQAAWRGYRKIQMSESEYKSGVFTLFVTLFRVSVAR